MDDLIDWINNRDEDVVALVAHWGVCFSLTGEQFENCEARMFEPGALNRKLAIFKESRSRWKIQRKGKRSERSSSWRMKSPDRSH